MIYNRLKPLVSGCRRNRKNYKAFFKAYLVETVFFTNNIQKINKGHWKTYTCENSVMITQQFE